LTNGVEKMLIAGILGSEGKLQTAGIISSMLASKGEKVSIIDPAGMSGVDGRRIAAYISELEKNNIDILILKINISDLDRYITDDLRFDVLIYANESNEMSPMGKTEYAKRLERVFSLIDDKGVAIVNADDSDMIKLLSGKKHKVITYGFNTKASITTSSIGDTVYKDGFICCLQRSISTRAGNIIEPQEYKLRLDAAELDSHDLLAAASFAIVNGIDLNSFSEDSPM
jgi:UDP-N-acetylmuramyl tripeptide synthase